MPSELSRRLAALFPAHLATVCDRAARALEKSGYGSLLVHSGVAPAVFLDDSHYPFKAQAPFLVWAPLTSVPDCFVYFEPGRKPVLVFHQPVDYWHKPAELPVSWWTTSFDIRTAADRSAARAALPGDLSRTAFVGAPFQELTGFGVAAVNPEHLLTRLDFERARKTPYEIECLREASRLGALGHAAALDAFSAGESEFGIELAFLTACGQREQELPYNPIIALNEGGAVLHYQVLAQQPPSQRHSMLIDAGAGFAGYGSDITRTVAHESPDFAALVGQLDEIQQSLCAGVRAGTDWRDLHLSAHRLLAELLRDADIVTLDAEAAVTTGLSSVFFPHGLGHLLGLQVHDVGGLARDAEGNTIPRPDGHPYLRLTRILEPGFVVTVEPGIYFIPQLLDEAQKSGLGRHINWTRVEGLKKFGGIRIEDDVVCTDTGCENLTRDAFRAIGRA